MSVGKRIKKIREDLGWSQVDLANHTNLTSAAISMIEKKINRSPSCDTLCQIAKALNTTPNILLGFEEYTISKLHKFAAHFGKILDLDISDRTLVLEVINRLLAKDKK